MERQELFKKISQETDVPYAKVKWIIETMEDIVMDVIATEDYINFSFAKIEGITKPPWRVTGAFRSLKFHQRNGCWSDAKVGFPKCTFSKEAKEWLGMDPHIYFEMPEHRYTTNARQFRKDNGIEEITEYQGLSEEKIENLCIKADLKEKNIEEGSSRLVDFNNNLKMKQNSKNAIFLRFLQEDLQRQKEQGVPEDQLVYKDRDQLLEEYYARKQEKQDAFLKENPGIKYRLKGRTKERAKRTLTDEEAKEFIKQKAKLEEKQKKKSKNKEDDYDYED